MIDSGVTAAVEGLLGSDPGVADAADLAEMSRWSSSLRAFADYADVRINRRNDELAAQGAADSGAHVLLDEGRLTGREAQATGWRDRVCSEMPQFDDALATGACTAGHVDALAKLTKDLSDEERCDLSLVVDDLVASAADQPVALFEKTTKAEIDKIRETHRPGNDADELDRQRAASKIKRWTDRDTGIKQTLISLDPLRDASLHAVIDAHLATLRQDPTNKHRSFDELRIEAVMTAVSAGPSAQRIPEVVMHVDHQIRLPRPSRQHAVRNGRRATDPGLDRATVVLRGDHHGGDRQPRRHRRSAVRRAAHRQSCPAPPAGGDVLDMCPPALPGGVLTVPDPSHHLVDPRRQDGAGQPATAV